MRSDLETHEYIDQYLNGELSGEEQDAFEQRMQNDSVFAELVEDQKLTNEVVFDQGQIDLKKQIRNDINKRYYDSTGIGNQFRKVLIAGAGILLAGAAGWHFFSGENTESKAPSGEEVIGLSKKDTTKEQEKHASGQPLSGPSSEKATEPTDQKTTGEPASSANPKDSNGKQGNKIRAKEPEVAQPRNIQPPEDTLPEAQENDTAKKQEREEPRVPDPPLPRYNEEADTVTKPDKRSNKEAGNQAKTENADPCDSISLQTKVQTKASCPAEKNGAILFNRPAEGKEPFRYSINNGKNFRKKKNYSGVKPGSYKVAVKDEQGCESHWIVQVGTKNCTKSYSINTAHNEKWEFPVEDDQNAVIEVISRSGKVVYQTKIKNGHPDQWDGTGNNGQPLEPGAYIFLIKYEDGTKEKGSITLIR